MQVTEDLFRFTIENDNLREYAMHVRNITVGRSEIRMRKSKSSKPIPPTVIEYAIFRSIICSIHKNGYSEQSFAEEIERIQRLLCIIRSLEPVLTFSIAAVRNRP